MRFLEFSDPLLGGLVGSSTAARYLADYLRDLGVTALIEEPDYVDRHYLDDFANYYARSFYPPPPHCRRLHFFKQITASELERVALGALNTEAERRTATDRLQNAYLGFVVLRPLVAAPIGRTVLATYPLDGRRRFSVVRPYYTNFLGMRLRVDGLAYQQQDGGAAVCASTALWSALQRVAFVAGHRTPTPFGITLAAKSPFPASHGLLESHMAEAISSLGYSADRFVPGENRGLFRAKLVACLDSQLPVVLGISRKIKTGTGESVVGHAVTVTGYAQPPGIGEVLPLPSDILPPLRMRAATLDTIYVHDDNLGFHAHYELVDSSDRDQQGNPNLKILRGRTNRPNPTWWDADLWDIESALVPKPEKVRLPLEDLFLNAVQHRPLIDLALPGLRLSYRVRFDSGVEYTKKNLVGTALDPAARIEFVRKHSLPRHIAVLAVHGDQDDMHFMDVLMDATTIARDPEKPNLLALIAPGIPKLSLAGRLIADIASNSNSPLVTAL